MLDDDGTVFVIHARPLTDAERGDTEGGGNEKTAESRGGAAFAYVCPRAEDRDEQFDREMVRDTFRSLSPKAKADWKKARQKPGRPRQGEGAKMISVTVERSLLAQTDALAKNMGVTRAGLIARGLKAVLAAEGKL